MANEIPDIPRDMRKVYRRLRRWRSSHARRVPIPDSLWAAAGELAREHGINRTAKALHLEYGKLKERAEAPGQEKKVVRKARSVIPRHARPPAPPTFMELITPRAGSVGERRGGVGRTAGPDEDRVQGCGPAELVALSRALWDDGA